MFGGNSDINDIDNSNIEAAGGDIKHSTVTTTNESTVFLVVCVAMVVVIISILCCRDSGKRQEKRNAEIHIQDSTNTGDSVIGTKTTINTTYNDGIASPMENECMRVKRRVIDYTKVIKDVVPTMDDAQVEKISRLLKKEGVEEWEDLATVTVDELVDIGIRQAKARRLTAAWNKELIERTKSETTDNPTPTQRSVNDLSGKDTPRKRKNKGKMQDSSSTSCDVEQTGIHISGSEVKGDNVIGTKNTNNKTYNAKNQFIRPNMKQNTLNLGDGPQTTNYNDGNK